MASVLGGYPAKAAKRRRENENNAKAQGRREKNERDPVLTCRDMRILPTVPTGPASSGMPRGARLFLP